MILDHTVYRYSKRNTSFAKKVSETDRIRKSKECPWETTTSLIHHGPVVMIKFPAEIQQNLVRWKHPDTWLPKYRDSIPGLSSWISGISLDGPKFMRLNYASPKDSRYFGTPVRTGTDILMLLLTSERVVWSLRLSGTSPDVLIILPWRDPTPNLEIRSFIHHGKLTAVSQYDAEDLPTDLWTLVSQFTSDDLENIQGTIMNFYRLMNERRELLKLDPIKSCTIDFTLVEKGRLELIEVNPFGADSPVGSCMFNWALDRGILYSEENSVVFRLPRG